MSFTSIQFIILFLATLAVLSVSGLFHSPKARIFRHVYLLVASYVFYGWWDWRFCFLMLLLTVVAYSTAKHLDNERYRRLAITIGIAVPLLILAFFKYTNFFLDSFSSAFGIENMRSLNIILPVGISFYTFQSMSYTIDVYRKKIKPAKLLDVALYISFFPQLVAGPIVKAQDFLPQLEQDRRVTLKGLEAGLQIFIMGMFKKIVLADRLSVFVDDVFAAPAAYSSLTVILAVISYALQIYFDFSGYSDMAIGCARCMGYDLQRNFNLPYLSKNPSEFWKRWHISLSTWLQEYLYIPLGGNRKGKTRTYINLMLTMILGGLWHGASWTFVIWGTLHGLALCVHKAVAKKRKDKKHLPAPVLILINNIFVCLCWIFFRADRFGTALCVLNKIFIWSGGVQQIYFWLIFAVVIEILYVIWCAVMSKKHPEENGRFTLNAYYFRHDLSTVKGLFLFFLEIMAVIGLAYTGGSPFIYFQF